ncbi:ribbon-helix-helix protein, CopG family [Propionicimonas sp.]
MIRFWLDPERAARLDAYAAREHKSRSQIIREALDQQLAH